MKFSFSLLALGLPASHAFVPAAVARTPTFLASTTRPDATSAIQEALEASKKFGATSPEARLAWEAVEELDSSDTR